MRGRFHAARGFPTLGFNTSSTSAWGNVRMRVAMVARQTRDRWPTMAKCRPLQAAAKSLIDQLSALAKDSRRYLHFDHPVRPRRQRRPSKLQSELGRLHGLDAANGTCSNTSYKTKSSAYPTKDLDAKKTQHMERAASGNRDKDHENRV